MILGNTEGVKKTILNELEAIHDLKLSKDTVITKEIVDIMCSVTDRIEREVSVAIDRKGRVYSVSIGDSTTVEIPLIDIKDKKLSGIRIIHTHPNGMSRLSALDISALIKLKLDCISALGVVEGKCTSCSLAFTDIEDNVLIPSIINDLSVLELEEFKLVQRISHMEKLLATNEIVEDNSEKAILVGCDNEESLDELEELAKACDVNVVYKVFQKRNKIDSAFYIGSGKAQEISMLCQEMRANMIIFDDELSGSHVRNLEELIGVKVIDRTTLILDIFAKRARTKESKIQVELAQLKYRLPRLSGLGIVLSRTGGGIGTKGPGEKKLETDRRHIRERLYDLKEELDKIKRNRETQREKRNRENIPKVSIVGYTNAGKSTLRNKLCEIALSKESAIKEKVFVADMLFATLDITTRAIMLQDNRIITLTDTVGFVSKLPHDLVESFKSTLEEVIYSDLLLHVVDSSSIHAMDQINAVEQVLSELNAQKTPTILILNKIDKAGEELVQSIRKELDENKSGYYKDIIEVSALEGINLENLLSLIQINIPYLIKEVEFLIPYNDQSVVSYFHRNAIIIEEEYRDDGTYIKAQVDDEVYNKTLQYELIK